MVQHADIDHSGIAGVGGSVATDAIWDAKGDLAGGTGANTAQKLTVGTNDMSLVAASGETTGLKWAFPRGTLIGLTSYAPASQTVYSISSATIADVDATNLQVTFDAPASGNILVSLTAYADISAGVVDGWWGIRESTTNVAGSFGRIIRNQANAILCTYRFYLTGISGGSHTYKWAFASTSGATTTRIIIQDGGTGLGWSPGLMEVWAA